MIRADLHAHSKYSEHPSEWFLQRLGAQESYVEPEFIYKTAKSRGMDLVTITDHNRMEGSIILQHLHPEDTFTGVESTVYFPEDDCKVHILVYGLSESQFNDIQKIRTDIYEMRDFLRQENLAHAVAHATYAVNGKISIEHLEKLILLFDVFEGINGGREDIHNTVWLKTLSSLTPEHIARLYERYRIEPFSDRPWIKGFTGGSDDHAGLFNGQSYTLAEIETANVKDFLDCIKNKGGSPAGRHNDYQSLVFMVYKVAYDFSKQKNAGRISGTILSQLFNLIFEKQKLGLKDRLKIKRLKSIAKKDPHSEIYRLLYELVEELRPDKKLTINEKLNIVHDKIAKISDAFLYGFFNACENDLKSGDLIGIIKNISATIPGIFLSVPFFSSLNHMHDNRDLLEELDRRFDIGSSKKSKSVLWFTDTLIDLNGVATTVQQLGQLAHNKNLDLKIVTSLREEEMQASLSPNIVNLPYIYCIKIPDYESYELKVPSILKSLKIIYDLKPDEIYISTPGPIGLLALLASKLLKVKSTGIYHTDFAMAASKIIEDESVSRILGNAVKWFYEKMDEIGVFTEDYIKILADRGFDTSKMRIFNKSIDSALFHPLSTTAEEVDKMSEIPKGINLLYAGRVSKDKNIAFLLDVYRELIKHHDDVNLVVAGDGPDLETAKQNARDLERVRFLGLVEHSNLPEIYSSTHALVFPSVTDTFGMAVLESQSCGLPALVSDKGGPKKIVKDGETGYVLPADDMQAWVKAGLKIIEMIKRGDPAYLRMKKMARDNAVKNYDWNKVVESIASEDCLAA
jgi:glycosyltransferase involved in cell wall biosynthesis/predicted metal-dependent phosphoesterase TrpH